MTTFVIPTTRVSSRQTIDFWIQAFGMELLAIYPEDATHAIDHAELRLGDGRVMAGTPRTEGLDQAIGGTSMYWVIDDEAEIDAIHARAVAAGAESVFAPHNADYGGRHCSLRDPDGHAFVRDLPRSRLTPPGLLVASSRVAWLTGSSPAHRGRTLARRVQTKLHDGICDRRFVTLRR